MKKTNSIYKMETVMTCSTILGALLSLSISQHYSSFYRLWLGASLSAFPGFLIGLAWKLMSFPDRQDWIRKACRLGLVPLVLLVFSLTIELPRMRREMRCIDELTHIKQDSIRRIDVYDENGRKKIASFTESGPLRLFAIMMKDAEGCFPSHPRYSHSWYVIVYGETNYKLDLHVGPDYPRRAVGYAYRSSNNKLYIEARFISAGLWLWVKEYLLD